MESHAKRRTKDGGFTRYFETLALRISVQNESFLHASEFSLFSKLYKIIQSKNWKSLAIGNRYYMCSCSLKLPLLS